MVIKGMHVISGLVQISVGVTMSVFVMVICISKQSESLTFLDIWYVTHIYTNKPQARILTVIRH